jgi:hypothetical protein
MRPMLAITLSFVLAARLASQGAAEDSVRAAEQARGQALLAADTVALSRLVADEFVEISRLGQARFADFPSVARSAIPASLCVATAAGRRW